jgi:hypothetical protein
MELKAMAADAIMGLSLPSAATGRPYCNPAPRTGGWVCVPKDSAKSR